MDKVALGKTVLRIFRFSLAIIILPMLHVQSSLFRKRTLGPINGHSSMRLTLMATSRAGTVFIDINIKINKKSVSRMLSVA